MRQVAALASPEDGGLHHYGCSLNPVKYSTWYLVAPVLMCTMNMLTEKLQRQTLNESTSSTSTTIKLPIATDETSTPTHHSRNSDSLTVKGTNLWTLSIDTGSHGNNKADGLVKRGGRGSKGIKSISANQNAAACDTSPSTPNAPPTKRHCRSLSVPPNQGDAYFFELFKPIPVYKEFPKHLQPKKTFARNFMQSGSPVSVDSGHVTSSEFQTPPGSPVPRPASAMSEISHNSSWFDHSPFKSNRFEILQNRSLSCEDRISCGPVGGVSCSHGLDSLRHASPPRVHRIPRCKSQPCVLHDRKCGKKRRHDYDRPTLDFTKMTQTAYSFPKPIPFSHSFIQKRSHREGDDLDQVFRLVPIASSPLDTDIPFKGLDNFPTSPIDDNAQPAMPPTTPTGRGTQAGRNNFQEPVEFLTDSGLDDCGCQDDQTEEDREVIFPLKDLDMNEIEKH